MRLKVEVCDEVYRPVVSVLHTGAIGVKFQYAGEVEQKGAEPTSTGFKKPAANTPKTPNAEILSLTEAIQGAGQPKARRRTTWRSRLSTVAVAVIAVIAVALVGMRITGFRTFTVMSGSMSPKYPVGVMIYVKPVEYHTLKVGDVISFIANNDNTVVTHRITGIEVDAKDPDVWRFKTKGDANEIADAKLVHYKNVLGTPVITIPFLGYIAHNIQRPPGLYIALVVGTLLLAWTFLPGTLEERRKTARKSVA